MALRLEGLRRENFENLEYVSSRYEGMQFRLNKMNDLPTLIIEWPKMYLKNSKEKIKIARTKWHLNLGHNKTMVHIW